MGKIGIYRFALPPPWQVLPNFATQKPSCSSSSSVLPFYESNLHSWHGVKEWGRHTRPAFFLCGARHPAIFPPFLDLRCICLDLASQPLPLSSLFWDGSDPPSFCSDPSFPHPSLAPTSSYKQVTLPLVRISPIMYTDDRYNNTPCARPAWFLHRESNFRLKISCTLRQPYSY